MQRFSTISTCCADHTILSCSVLRKRSATASGHGERGIYALRWSLAPILQVTVVVSGRTDKSPGDSLARWDQQIRDRRPFSPSPCLLVICTTPQLTESTDGEGWTRRVFNATLSIEA